jgi:hypothetical protein
MNSAAIRINARLTGEDARRFLELQQGGRAASDVLRDALREYHAAHAKPKPNALALLRDSGFVGGFDAPADLSSRYKDYLGDALAEKYPLGVHEDRADYAVKPKPRRRK